MTETTEHHYTLNVDPPQQHSADNFTMFVPALNLLVQPDENNPWQLTTLQEETKGGSIGEQPEEFNAVNIKFEGAPTNLTGYQAAIIRFFLPERYQWFGNGLEVISIFEQVDLLNPEPPVRHFNHYLTRKSDDAIVLTIEVEKQVAFSSQLNFRLKVIDNEYTAEHGDQAGNVQNKVLVSEDPIVRPTRPVDE